MLNNRVYNQKVTPYKKYLDKIRKSNHRASTAQRLASNTINRQDVNKSEIKETYNKPELDKYFLVS